MIGQFLMAALGALMPHPSSLLDLAPVPAVAGSHFPCNGNGRRTGIRAAQRAALKRRNQKRSRKC